MEVAQGIVGLGKASDPSWRLKEDFQRNWRNSLVGSTKLHGWSQVQRTACTHFLPATLRGKAGGSEMNPTGSPSSGSAVAGETEMDPDSPPQRALC